MQKIVTYLWFDGQAEEAAQLYTSIFKNSKIIAITRYPEATEEVAKKPAGSVMTVSFEIEGQQFAALNGGPQFKFSEAVSFMVSCGSQKEVDYFWDRLTADGGSEGSCGWLKDKFGVSWQIIPSNLEELLSEKEPHKRERVMGALLKMKKIDISALKQAYNSQ